MFVSYFSLITVLSDDAIIWPHVWVSLQRKVTNCAPITTKVIVPRQQVIPTPPTSVRLLLDPKQFPTRCSVVPPSFSRLSPSQFPASAARLLLTSEDGRYAKRLIPADFALFPPQLFNILPWPLQRTKFLATQSWACSRNHAAYRLINTNVMVLNAILTKFLFWRDCLILRGWYRTERSEAVLVGFVKIAAIRFPSYCFHCRAMLCTANGFIKLALIALILI